MLGLDGSLVFLVSCFEISGADVSMTVEKFVFLNPYETSDFPFRSMSFGWFL